MIFGHEEKVRFFKRLAEEDELGQAYLFYGEPQVGKFLFAKHLAYFLEYGKFEITEETLVDTLIISSEESNSIGVPDIEEVKGRISQKPFKSSKRLIIVRDAEELTPQAQSSLLKFVEEASHHTSFIFIASDPQVLLPPLASRLMEVYFSRLPQEEVTRFLVEEKGVSESKAREIADKSFGRPGRAIDLLEGVEGEDDDFEREISDKIVKLYLDDKVSNSSKIAYLLQKQGEASRFNLNPRIHRKDVSYNL